MKVARVFPRKTNATPEDSMVFIGDPPQIGSRYVLKRLVWFLEERSRQASYLLDRLSLIRAAGRWRENMNNKKTVNFDNLKIVKPLGYENLYDFARRIVKELSEKKYESVTMDCGEGIMIIADSKSTVDTIMKQIDRDSIDGFKDRYKQFEAKIKEGKAYE